MSYSNVPDVQACRRSRDKITATEGACQETTNRLYLLLNIASGGVIPLSTNATANFWVVNRYRQSSHIIGGIPHLWLLSPYRTKLLGVVRVFGCCSGVRAGYQLFCFQFTPGFSVLFVSSFLEVCCTFSYRLCSRFILGINS
jgi:hypothetical protein